MTTLKEFIELVRTPHEKLRISYTQKVPKKSKAYAKQLSKFQMRIDDIKDFKYDDRVSKFEYHSAFYFYYYLLIRYMTTHDCSAPFITHSEKTLTIKRNLIMIELLTRFK